MNFSDINVELKELFYQMAEALNESYIHQSKMYKKSAEMGWFPCDVIDFGYVNSVLQGQNALDEYMSEEITIELDYIEKTIIRNNPNRSHIINNAFNLFRDGNYIACIPLLLTQSDGILFEKISKYLYTKKDQRHRVIKTLIEEKPELGFALEPLLADTQFQKTIDNSTAEDKGIAPNRNGILHGDLRHLDYGTKLNALKCISLLSYVSSVSSEVI